MKLCYTTNLIYIKVAGRRVSICWKIANNVIGLSWIELNWSRQCRWQFTHLSFHLNAPVDLCSSYRRCDKERSISKKPTCLNWCFCTQIWHLRLPNSPTIIQSYSIWNQIAYEVSNEHTVLRLCIGRVFQISQLLCFRSISEFSHIFLFY